MEPSRNGNGRRPRRQRAKPASPPSSGDLLARTEQDLRDEATALRLLHHMAVLFDRDRLLQTVTLPLEELALALASYLQPRPDAFRERSRLEESLAECAWFVLPDLVTQQFVEEVQRHIQAALERRRNLLDQKALTTALILSRLEQTPKELAANGLWNFLFRRSMMELLELPSRELNLPPEVVDVLRAIPLAALHEPPPPQQPPAAEQAVKDVYHGLEAGYLREHLGFSYLVRFPFVLAVLFPRRPETGRPRDPEAEDRLMMATVESVAREGAQMGAVNEMLRLYRRARDAALSDRERHFYSALVTALESFEPEENPVLPALYYEHYLHYLSGGMEKDREAIRDILDSPLEAAAYERYMDILRHRNQTAAAGRVKKICDEVREWRDQNR